MNSLSAIARLSDILEAIEYILSLLSSDLANAPVAPRDRRRTREPCQLLARSFIRNQLLRSNVDKDRIEGIGNQAKGALKEAAGKVTGDAKLKSEGAAEKAAGKVQNAVGSAKDSIRDASHS